MGNGLANRFLFACVRRSQELPFGGDRVNTSPLVKRVGDLLSRLMGGDTPIGWARSAKPLWRQAYHDLSQGQARSHPAPSPHGPRHRCSRLRHWMHLLDGAEDLEEPHLRAAMEVWRYCDQSASAIFGSSTGDPLADDIHRMLKASPDGLTRAGISDLLGRHRRKDEIGQALAALKLAPPLGGPVETRPTRGRPEERWFAL